MSVWGILDGGDTPPQQPTQSSDVGPWGTLGDTAAPASPKTPPAGASPRWGDLDGSAPPRHARDGRSPGDDGDAPALTPEATASLLTAGDLVWVNTEPGVVALGSGQRLSLVTPQTDRLYGWRQARIVEPATLTADLVPIPATPLRHTVADEPMSLYRPPAAPAQRSADRVQGFPVGAGPDLHELLEQRIAAAKQQYRRMADEVNVQAQMQIAEAERLARARTEAVQRQAADAAAEQRRWAEQEVARADRMTERTRAEMSAQIHHHQGAAQRLSSQVATLRLVVAALGGLALILLLVVLVTVSMSAR